MSENQSDHKVAKVEPTFSQRFTSAVVKEFSNQVGVLELTPLQQRLAQHMFIAIDTQLKGLETKRTDQNRPAIVWANINMAKLAIDAVHRVELGLDALISNHIHPIPYLNSRTKLYDLDLRIGYAGKDCYKRKMALDPPKDIIYELVCKKDEFTPIKKSAKSEVESYQFDIPNAFDRGEVVGGFGYIIYEDPKKNKLVLVSKADFDKSKNLAKGGGKFWEDYPTEMKYKTLVHRTLAQIGVDPEKVNASYMKVEIDDAAGAAERDIAENANSNIVDVEPEEELKTQRSTWDPCTSKLQQRYPADKVDILNAECKKRSINISGFLPSQAHDVLLKAIKETEQTHEQATQESNGKIYLHCPKYEDRRALEMCETDKCGKFATCDTAQDTISEAMARAAKTETDPAEKTAAGQPEF